MKPHKKKSKQRDIAAIEALGKLLLRVMNGKEWLRLDEIVPMRRGKKLSERYDITFEEFKTLRERGLLRSAK